MMLKLFLSVSVFFSIASAAIRFLTKEDLGSIFILEEDPDKHYFLPAVSIQDITVLGVAGNEHEDFSLATSIRTTSSPFSRKFLEAQFGAFRQLDDVWNDKFLETLFIGYENDAHAFFDDSGKEWLIENGVRNLYLTKKIEKPKFKQPVDINIGDVLDVPSHGPWLIRAAHSIRNIVRIHPVFGLFEDDQEAFTVGALPNYVTGGWIPTNITLPENPQTQLIPVPSRLSAWSGGTLPLAGLRFGVKDIYDINGLPTAAGSKVYADTYPIPDKTAPSVQRLLDLGATIIGKTRTSQFAHAAHPWEFNDVPYSWNPRGDGYLTAGASSSGSACAVAAYDWVDFSIGSDTRGSVRKPAALVGVLGIRPTLETMDMTGIIPVSEDMDTVGFFARDTRIFEAVAKNWYAEATTIDRRPTLRLPKHVIYPIDHFPLPNPAAQLLVNHFLQQLRKHLNIIKKEQNITELITPYFPSQSFEEFQAATNRLAEYQSWQDVGKPLVQSYISKFGAEEVMDLVFDPIPQHRFRLGKSHSLASFNEAKNVKNEFTEAMADHVFLSHEKTCADSLLIYDAGTGGLPSFRISELNDFEGASEFLMTSPPSSGSDSSGEVKLKDYLHFVASMAELPEVTIPLGQVPYLSKVTNKEEWLPVSVQLVTRRGCDGVLWELVRKLGDKGVVGPIKTGKQVY